MEFILQTYNKDNQKLLADGPVTKSKAILNYSDNKTDLKMKIEIDGTRREVENALAVYFQIVSLGDKTMGEFKFSARQTQINEHLKEKDVKADGFLTKEDIAKGIKQGEISNKVTGSSDE